MDPIHNLIEAARAGNIDGLYEAIKNHPNVLKEIDEIPFVNTPLHEAASAGQTNFATVMIDLAPSFASKLNPDCLSPLDLAVINNHYDTVKRLVSIDGKLVRVKGKDRLTPLHHAAESDDRILCLIELLLARPDSIEDLTIRDETALDIAMKSSSGAEAFEILYGWVKRAGDHKQLLQKKDAKGNSAETYHKKQQPKNGKSLQDVKAEKPSPHDNAEDATQNMLNYLRASERNYEKVIRKVFQFMLWVQWDLNMDMRNVVLVVAVLIANAAYQAILSPPGEKNGSLKIHNNSSSAQHNNSNLGFTVVNQTMYHFIKLAASDGNFFQRWFSGLNTVAFYTSLEVIIIVLPLRAYTSILHLSLIFMQACYWSYLEASIYIGSLGNLFCVYYVKLLYWMVESHKPDLLAY